MPFDSLMCVLAQASAWSAASVLTGMLVLLTGALTNSSRLMNGAITWTLVSTVVCFIAGAIYVSLYVGFLVRLVS